MITIDLLHCVDLQNNNYLHKTILIISLIHHFRSVTCPAVVSLAVGIHFAVVFDTIVGLC